MSFGDRAIDKLKKLTFRKIRIPDFEDRAQVAVLHLLACRPDAGDVSLTKLEKQVGDVFVGGKEESGKSCFDPLEIRRAVEALAKSGSVEIKYPGQSQKLSIAMLTITSKGLARSISECNRLEIPQPCAELLDRSGAKLPAYRPIGI